ncbi:MAG: YdiU family protein [Tepidimonas sp.]|uniref:protein adenylyltransferase SelO n=1 Tax=Tepidimonas sp. TaxID=2002775 RepID=UPI00259D5A6B|nr:YdiU family protein [Tepidimonas sp.]MDM7456798.1 YdiU family protein [Tepidimonas sp.]
MNDPRPAPALLVTACPAPLEGGAPPLRADFATALPELTVPWTARRWPAPALLTLDEPLALALGWSPAWLRGPDGLALLAGQALPPGTRPVAQIYAGHQFGGWVPRLGDGRALLLGEAELAGPDGVRTVDVALKGSGATPLARGGDGLAALGPMLREALISAAMHALGIPTTRALAVLATGQTVWRDGEPLPGALLVRVAASHLRVGTFQWVAAQGDPALLRRLLAFALRRHDPELAAALPAVPDGAAPVVPSEAALAWLRAVVTRQAHLVAQWMAVGFIHGVMNTDNMAIGGETIDYGPCAFMEGFDPATVYSSIDHGGRYAWGNQPRIAAWNLARLAETVLPLLHADEEQAVALASEAVRAFSSVHRRAWRAVMRAKLGLTPPGAPCAAGPWAWLADEGPDDAWAADDDALIGDWLVQLAAQQADWTLVHRRLADVAATTDEGESAVQSAARAALTPLLREPTALDGWLARWAARLMRGGGSAPQRAAALRCANPAVIARNLRVEEALAAAQQGDLAPWRALHAALQRPFDEPADERLTEPAPREWARRYVTFCGT